MHIKKSKLPRKDYSTIILGNDDIMNNSSLIHLESEFIQSNQSKLNEI